MLVQLHGVIASPDGQTVYATGMATGRVYRFDTVARNMTDSLEVGPNPRAMTLSDDGSKLLVTRFISDKDSGQVYHIDISDFNQFEVIELPSIELQLNLMHQQEVFLTI